MPREYIFTSRLVARRDSQFWVDRGIFSPTDFVPTPIIFKSERLRSVRTVFTRRSRARLNTSAFKNANVFFFIAFVGVNNVSGSTVAAFYLSAYGPYKTAARLRNPTAAIGRQNVLNANCPNVDCFYNYSLRTRGHFNTNQIHAP